MEDYPRTVTEMEERFSTEEACRDYLISFRWPTGFVCPRCQASGNWTATRGRFICRACRYQGSVTAGTIFQDTRKPLRMWFRAAWHITRQKNGASALSLQQELGLGSYMTAWTWLHKFRRAMVRPGRDRLQGTVEADESYWGCEEKGVVGRLTEDKALIAVVAEESGKGIGRIRLRSIPDLTKASLHGFIYESVEPGSTVRTDGLRAYLGLKEYTHDRQVQRRQPEGKHLLPHVHRVISLLKRGCLALIKVLLVIRIWITTWMNSHSVSIAVPRVRVASFSTACYNKPFKSILLPTKVLLEESPTTTYSSRWSQLNKPIGHSVILSSF